MQVLRGPVYPRKTFQALSERPPSFGCFRHGRACSTSFGYCLAPQGSPMQDQWNCEKTTRCKHRGTHDTAALISTVMPHWLTSSSSQVHTRFYQSFYGVKIIFNNQQSQNASTEILLGENHLEIFSQIWESKK